jgi:hypothetical protein
LVVIDEVAGQIVEVAELAVAIGMLASLGHLGVGLQRIAQTMQQAQHRPRGHGEPLADEFLGQLRGRLRGPSQQRHRVPPRLGMDQFVQRLQQARLLVDQRLVAAARRPQTCRRLDSRRHLSLGLDHRVAAHPRRHGHCGFAAPSQHLRRRPRHDPPLQLVQMRQDHPEEPRERLRRQLHTLTILRAY